MIYYLIAFILTLFFMNRYLSWKNKVNINDNVEVKECKQVKNNKIISIIYLLLMIFPFWFISAFRYDVGTDYFNTYVKYFEHTAMGWKPYSEPLFQLLNNLLVEFNFNVTWLFVITSFVFLLFIFKTILEYSDNPYISLIVFFVSSIFFNSLNNVRQYVALAIAFYGFMSKKSIKSIIFITIGSLIHFSALCFLPILIIKKLRITRNDFYYLTLCFLCLSPLLCFLLNQFLLHSKYYYFINIENPGFSLLLVLVNVLITLFVLIYYDDKDKKFSNLSCLQVMTFVLCICSMIMQNEELWMRIIRITSISQFLLIPSLVKHIRHKHERGVIKIIIYASYIVYTVYTVYIMGGLDVFPYQFIFQK